MLAHHQRLNLRAGIVGVSVAAPDERCICAEHASRADVRSRAFPAASWRTRALHIRSKLITHSAAHGNDLCSSKIAVVSVISGMNEGARYCIAHVLLHRYFMAPPVIVTMRPFTAAAPPLVSKDHRLLNGEPLKCYGNTAQSPSSLYPTPASVNSMPRLLPPAGHMPMSFVSS